MHDNFSSKVKDVIAFSKEEALRLGQDYIGTEHLLLGILRQGEGKAVTILNSLGNNLRHLRNKLEGLTQKESDLPENPNRTLHLTKQADKALKTTFLEAKLYKDDAINTAHLLLCILRNDNDPVAKILYKYNTSYAVARNEYNFLYKSDAETNDPKSDFPSEESGKMEDKPKKPFDENGKGFRDALIWLSILDFAEIIEDRKVIFISNNHKDFSESKMNLLHPDLIEETRLRNVEILYYISINNQDLYK